MLTINKIFLIFLICSLLNIYAKENRKYQSKYGPRTEPYYPRNTPYYKINLNDEYIEQWREIIADKKPTIHAMLKFVKHTFIVPILFSYVPYSWLESYNAEMEKEAKAIAELADVGVGDVFLLNFMYESNAFCTSIIAEDPFGNLLHGYNLDYLNLIEFISELAFIADYHRDGELQFRANGYGALMGVLAGEKPGKFAISVNQRNTPDHDSIIGWIKGFSKNIYTFLFKKEIPIPYIMRNTLNLADDYNDALYILSTTQTVAPIYYILSGITSNQGAIITKNRDGIDSIATLNTNNGTWFLAQTNYDRNLPDKPLDNRRDAAEYELEVLSRERITRESLLTILTKYPLYGSKTALTILMSAQNDYLKCDVWYFFDQPYD